MDWFLDHTKILFFIVLAVWAIRFIIERRATIREWFGSVSSFLFLLLMVFGIYTMWRDWGFSSSSLLYGMLILVIAGLLAGLVIVVERLNSVHEDLRALRGNFEIMFGPEVERRRKLAAGPVISSSRN